MPDETGARLPRPRALRSEEHTSELQSLTNLVCRLLLEKQQPPVVEFKDLVERDKAATTLGARLVFLDGVQDPGNLGSVIRSAAFFGAHGFVIPKCQRAS